MQGWVLGIAAFLASIVFLFGVAVMVAKFFRKVEQGRALLINKLKGEPEVTFTGGLVLPVIYKAETMDISVKTIAIDRRGKDGLICQDNVRADITVTFFVRVNKTRDDVLKVAQMVGCSRASDQETLEDLFNAKFSEALKTVGKQLDFEDLYKERDNFKDQIIRVIGKDLNGYVLDDAAIDYLEQTPMDMLDKDNILDSRGIKKITELTVEQNVKTNFLRNEEKKNIKKQDVEAQEAILELEKQQKDAEAKQAREVASIRAREDAETKKVQAEEFKKSEMARVKAEEEVQVANEGKLRQVEVARKNRERVIAIETERVEKDRQLEVINRERETELNRINKEKEIEQEKKEIADIVRGRVAVDKTVAEEEERIKDTRAIAEAKRNKEVQVTLAEAEARENMIKQTVAAEAMQEVATFKAKEKLTLAEADLEAADKQAKAKIRLAEGVQAESAAAGLAKVRVREADAIALEKEGLAQAKVTEQTGLAKVRVDEADAIAIQKRGNAEAQVIQDKALAEAKGHQERGLADVRVREADAQAIVKQGQAEGMAVKAKMSGEAQGLAEKAKAMAELSGEAREHEEFRIRLDKDKVVEMATISAKKEMAEVQAEIMKKAFDNANISIVGGDGQFFDKFINAVSVGKSIDGALDNSDALQNLFKDYINGKESLPHDLRSILMQGGVSSQTLQNLSVSAVLARMAMSADGTQQDKIRSLMEHAKQLGLEDIPASGRKN